MKKNNKGFTLVELIVVLVILAILAAILVPTLLGYIERARSEKDYSTAQTMRVAAQATIDQAYGDGYNINNAGGGGATAITKLEQMTGTFAYSGAGTPGKYVSLTYQLAGIDTSKVTSFSFYYEKGVIKYGSVVIAGRTYTLGTDGNWSVS